MKKNQLISLVMLAGMAVGMLEAGCGKGVDNRYLEQATATVDSVVALEPGREIKAIEFQNLKTPALFNDSIDDAVMNAHKSFQRLIMMAAFSGADLKNPEVQKDFSKLLTDVTSPLKEKVAELEKNAPTKCFAFATIVSPQDSVEERWVYVLDSKNPSKIEKSVNAAQAKNALDEILFLIHAQPEDFNLTKSELKDFAKKHNDNPVYEFILNATDKPKKKK